MSFAERKERLEVERVRVAEALAEIGNIDGDRRLAENFLELAKSVDFTYQIADSQKKRRMVEILFSNRTLIGNELCLEPQKWLQDKVWTMNVLCGPPTRTRT